MTRPALALLHAFPLDGRMWDRHARTLEAREYPLLAPDLPALAPEPSLGAWADALLARAPERFVPVGVSMGGYLALELWLRAPERIVALVLADTRAAADDEQARGARDESIRVVREEGPGALWERLRDGLFAPAAPAEAVERARALALDQAPESLVAALTALRDRRDATATLPTVTVPALVLVGAEDALTPPAQAERLAAALPDARLVTIPGAGHLAPLERPDAFTAALLGFLEERIG